jgi:hypothetical protein
LKLLRNTAFPLSKIRDAAKDFCGITAESFGVKFPLCVGEIEADCYEKRFYYFAQYAVQLFLARTT